MGVQMTQQHEALRLANRKRTERAKLKRTIATGRSVAPLILDPPELLKNSSRSSARGPSIADILSYQPKWGRAKAERHLRCLGINPAIEPWQLSPNRRKLLAESLVTG
jgi:hypothetical protein